MATHHATRQKPDRRRRPPLKGNLHDRVKFTPYPAPEWHNNQDLNQILDNYHREFGRQPIDDMQESNEPHDAYMKDIQEGLTLKLAPLTIKRLNYTGSSYEQVKVSDGLEYDVMIVLDGKGLDPQEVKPGYVTLRPSPSCRHDQFAHILDNNGVISAEKFRRKFHGSVQKVLTETQNPDLKDKNKLTPHGPAVQMDVLKTKEDKTKKEIWFSVDLVPTIEVLAQDGKRHCYVVKPLKGDPQESLIWRQSFSVEEREKFDRMDVDNGRRKQCLRILKVLRTRTGMKLTSYHLKTLLFHEMERHTSWRPDQLAVRVLGLLAQLHIALHYRYLSHYFLPGINLLDTVPGAALNDMKNQVDKLINSEECFQNTFARPLRPKPSKRRGTSTTLPPDG